MKQSFPIAVYFDLENINHKLDLNKLMESIMLELNSGMEESQDISPFYAIKVACGDSNSISNFRTQLGDLNFTILEATHVANKKNRADLILSVEAFESLYTNNPNICLYVFITSDTDFTVVMDKLRKYGKYVMLVTRKSDKEKMVFVSSSDRILSIEDNLKESEEKKDDSLHKLITSNGFTAEEARKMVNVLESFEKDKWIYSSSFGTALHSIVKDFSYKGRSLNSQGKFFEKLKEKGYIEIRKDSKLEYFKVLK